MFGTTNTFLFFLWLSQIISFSESFIPSLTKSELRIMLFFQRLQNLMSLLYNEFSWQIRILINIYFQFSFHLWKFGFSTSSFFSQIISIIPPINIFWMYFRFKSFFSDNFSQRFCSFFHQFFYILNKFFFKFKGICTIFHTITIFLLSLCALRIETLIILFNFYRWIFFHFDTWCLYNLINFFLYYRLKQNIFLVICFHSSSLLHCFDILCQLFHNLVNYNLCPTVCH